MNGFNHISRPGMLSKLVNCFVVLMICIVIFLIGDELVSIMRKANLNYVD